MKKSVSFKMLSTTFSNRAQICSGRSADHVFRAYVLLSDIARDPANYYRSIQRITASVASAVVWGHRGPTPDDFWARVSLLHLKSNYIVFNQGPLQAVYDAMDNYSVSLEMGVNPPVDEFPFLKYIPDRLAYWKRRAKGSFKCMDETWNEARRRVEMRRQKGIKRDSIIDAILDGEKHSDLKASDHQMNHFLGVLVEGGADTTSSSTLTSLMYLALHPEFQEKAQKELDAVCGSERYAIRDPCLK